MKVKKKDCKNLYTYFARKSLDGGSDESYHVEMIMDNRSFSDVALLQAIRDFCPLEFLEFDENKYARWLYSTILPNIFEDRETFTKDFCIIDVPRSTFSDEEANILINILRRCGYDLGLRVRKLDTYTITTDWKKEYITDEEYEFTPEEERTFDKKFQSEDDTYSKKFQTIKKEIEENIIQLAREKILSGKTIFGGNNLGEKQYEISEFIQLLLNVINFKNSPKMNMFVAEIYYRYGLPEQAYKVLDIALKLEETDDNTAKKIKRIQQLVRSKKPKDKFRAMEEFTGEYFEDITGEYIPLDKTAKDIIER